MRPLCIYIHGFNSSGNAAKSRLLKQALHHLSLDYHSPDLPHASSTAMATLRALCDDQRPLIFVGSSLGGFYACYLAHQYPDSRAVLINPALRPWSLYKEMQKDYENVFTGEKFAITQKDIEEIRQFEVTAIHKPERFLLLLQTDDEVLNYQESLMKFPDSPKIVRHGGGHLFTDFEHVLPQVIEFIQG